MEALMIVFGVLTIFSASGVVFSKKSLHSALYLILTLVFVAVHFALLGSEFLAVLQLIIYAGAIMVLVVFVIMLMGIDDGENRDFLGVSTGPLGTVLAVIFASLFLVIVVFSINADPEFLHLASQPGGDVSVSTFGVLLLTKYWFPMQITGVLLLAAIISAVLLAHEKSRPLREGRGLRAVRRTTTDSEDN